MARPKVAYLACGMTIPGTFARREDAYEHDLAAGVLGMGLHYVGRSLDSIRWDATQVDWAQFETVVVGTTWDYTVRFDEFISQLTNIEQQTRLLNPIRLVRWNAKKNYLRDLADKGISTIPTIWLNACSEQAVRSAAQELDTDYVVIKPEVGAGAWRQSRWRLDQPFPHPDELPLGATMVQPYLPEIAAVGEVSMIFFNHQFSHAVLKKAKPGDYRIQSSFGGWEEAYHPSDEDERAAQSVLSACQSITDERMLYARVDMLRDQAGVLRLMELELIEPYLYPMYARNMSKAFAQAYMELLQG